MTREQALQEAAECRQALGTDKYSQVERSVLMNRIMQLIKEYNIGYSEVLALTN